MIRTLALRDREKFDHLFYCKIPDTKEFASFLACVFIDLWMHAGSLESTKETSEFLEAIAESNSSFLSYLPP